MMNNQNKYVSEEQYEKGIKLLKRARRIVLAIGMVIFAIGICLAVTGFTTEEPSMSSPDWFEVSSRLDAFKVLGLFLTIASVMLTGGIFGQLTMIIHSREISGFTASQGLPVIDEMAEPLGKTLGKVYSAARPVMRQASRDAAQDVNDFFDECENINETNSEINFCPKCGTAVKVVSHDNQILAINYNCFSLLCNLIIN